MGNAIVRRQIPDEDICQSMLDYLKGRPLWEIETDFGNRIRLTDNEIDEMFIRGGEEDYDEWASGKAELARQNEIKDRGL